MTNDNGTVTKSRALSAWVAETARLTAPSSIVWCDGSEAERDRLTKEAIQSGVLIPLNGEKRPNCYLHRSNPNDVARTEEVTFVCTARREDAGVTNNWMAPDEAYRKLGGLLEGSMKDRTMYVVPYVMVRWARHSPRSALRLLTASTLR